MGRKVDLDDLLDADDVAQLLGLTNRRTVSVYQARYPAMPRPVLDKGGTRVRLWLRSDVEDWVLQSGRLK